MLLKYRATQALCGCAGYEITFEYEKSSAEEAAKYTREKLDEHFKDVLSANLRGFYLSSYEKKLKGFGRLLTVTIPEAGTPFRKTYPLIRIKRLISEFLKTQKWDCEFKLIKDPSKHQEYLFVIGKYNPS